VGRRRILWGMSAEEGARRAATALGRDVADALAAIVESSNDAIYSKNDQAVLTSWNDAAERLYGYSASEVIGKHVSILVPPEKRGEETRILEQILRGERIHHYETQRMRKDGSRVMVSISVSAVHDRNGEIVEAAVIARDLSERRHFEKALEEERERQVVLARKQALELNDEVVQGLAAAKLAIEMGELEEGLRSVTATLERARTLVSRLLDEHQDGGVVRPGDLVRGRRDPDLD
jgi:PAS domain S-box-containing protein